MELNISLLKLNSWFSFFFCKIKKNKRFDLDLLVSEGRLQDLLIVRFSHSQIGSLRSSDSLIHAATGFGSSLESSIFSVEGLEEKMSLDWLQCQLDRI